MTGVAGAAAVVLAGLFAVAAIRKTLAPSSVAADFASLGLPRSPLLVALVAAVEGAVAIALVVAPRLGGSAAVALLVVFSTVLWSVIRRGVEARCGCFGASTRRRVGRLDLVRNGGLAILAVVTVVGATGDAARPGLPGVVTVTASVASAFVVAQLVELRQQVGSIFRIELAGEAT